MRTRYSIVSVLALITVLFCGQAGLSFDLAGRAEAIRVHRVPAVTAGSVLLPLLSAPSTGDSARMVAGPKHKSVVAATCPHLLVSQAPLREWNTSVRYSRHSESFETGNVSGRSPPHPALSQR